LTNQPDATRARIKRLIVADPSLRGFSGHYYEYARAVGAAADRAGIQSILIGNEAFSGDSSLNITPLFRLQTYDLVESRLPTPVRMMLTTRKHSKDLKLLSRKLKLGNDDLVLMPTVSIPVLFGLLYRFGINPISRNNPTVAVVLRDTMKIHRSAVKTLMSLFFKLARTLRAGRWLRICVDTEELRDEYSTITNFPISVLPIPIERETFEKFDDTSSGDQLTISMLGDARIGKGIDMIPGLVETLLEQYPGRLNFVIQTSTPVVGADSEVLHSTLARLIRLEQEHDALLLLPEPLTTEEYFSTIARSDIMLHPYRADSYRYQSSGMFAEAMALGKAVVIPADTWMSSELERFDGGGAAFEIGDSDSLLQSTKAVIDDIEVYRGKAQAAKASWLAFHNSDQILSRIPLTAPK
jgi:glycosyltransferase involved in cell wall biosynthesis